MKCGVKAENQAHYTIRMAGWFPWIAANEFWKPWSKPVKTKDLDTLYCPALLLLLLWCVWANLSLHTSRKQFAKKKRRRQHCSYHSAYFESSWKDLADAANDDIVVAFAVHNLYAKTRYHSDLMAFCDPEKLLKWCFFRPFPAIILLYGKKPISSKVLLDRNVSTLHNVYWQMCQKIYIVEKKVVPRRRPWRTNSYRSIDSPKVLAIKVDVLKRALTTASFRDKKARQE